MTRDEFTVLCAEAAVAPEVALENENIRQALADRDDAEVRRLLKEEF